MPRRAGTVEETPWWLDVNGERVAVGTASPERIEALAAGRLLVDGYLDRAGELLGLSVIYDPPGCVGVRVRVDHQRATTVSAERRHRVSHGCGVRHVLECEPHSLPSRTAIVLPPLETLPDLFRELFASADRHRDTGGVHTAALTDGRTLLYQIEDVGRHNAVDKTIGWAMMEGAALADLGLLTSARVSAEIAWKAVRGRLAWVASRSIPTDLAVEVAAAASLPIVARAAGRDVRVYGVSEPLREGQQEPQGPAPQ